MKNVIYEDQLCNADYRKKDLVCYRGTLKFTGNNIMDFRLYHEWCKGCDKIRIVDRKELRKIFNNIVKNINKECDMDEE